MVALRCLTRGGGGGGGRTLEILLV
jgi:hypothetical protein